MRACIFVSDWVVNGLTTSACRWAEALGVEIFTWSPTGVLSPQHRSDYPITVLGTNPRFRNDSISKLIEYDVILVFSYGQGTKHLKLLRDSGVPLVGFNGGTDFLTPWSDEVVKFLESRNFVGHIFSTQRLKDSVEMGFLDLVKGKLCTVISDPIIWDGEPFTFRTHNNFICTSPVEELRGTLEIVKAFCDYDLERGLGIHIEFWGEIREPAYLRKIRSSYRTFWDSHYHGTYDHRALRPNENGSRRAGQVSSTALEALYHDSRYAIDLTPWHGGGDLHMAHLEALICGVTPLIWSHRAMSACIEVSEVSAEALVEKISFAASLTEEQRGLYWKHGVRYLDEYHHPEESIVAMMEFLEQISSTDPEESLCQPTTQ